MDNSILPLILHIILLILTRMIQGVPPHVINFHKLSQFSKPWILFRFSVLRVLYLLLLIYQSVVLMFHFDEPICIMYYFWFILSVLWVKPFTEMKFKHASIITIFMTLISIFVSVHFPLFIPTVFWSIYVLYITSWYRWCLPV